MMIFEGKKRCAVIGAGFIGLALIRALLRKGHDVVVLDRNRCPPEFTSLLAWHQGEFNEVDKLNEVIRGSDCIYNLISSSTPLNSLHLGPETQDIENNILFLDSCVKIGVKRIIFASSASVYGIQAPAPISENAATNPISQYGVIKLSIEKYHLLAQHMHGVEVCILRIANPYGPGQKKGFVAKLCDCILNDAPISLADMGRVVRDFIYIDDLADTMLRIGTIKIEPPNLMNISSGAGYTLLEVVRIASDVMGKPISNQFTNIDIKDIPYSVLDNSIAKEKNLLCLSNEIYFGLSKTLKSLISERKNK